VCGVWLGGCSTFRGGRGAPHPPELQQDQQAAALRTEEQMHRAHRNEHGNTLEGTAPAGSQRHATIHQHTQNNNADTSAAPGDESAGVGELRSGGVEHSHGCESELASAVKSTQGRERGAGTSIQHRDTGQKRKCESASQHVAVLVKKFKQMPHTGDGTLAQHLVAQVHERPWRRARKRERDEEEESADGVTLAKVKKKREMHRKIETSRHTERTLQVWQRMLEQGTT
jgi:hypothetical protein